MTLPLLVSVPHAGLDVPARLRSRCVLTFDEIAADGDVGAREIYDIASHVRVFVRTDVARAVLDMNRPEEDRTKDGVVKTHTCWDVPIWSGPLGEEDVTWLLEEHHRPYHAALGRGARAPVELGLDLHTMAAHGPPVGPDPGMERPAVCLSNADGTCPRAWIETLRDCFEAALAREIRINDPFRGGWITRSHAGELPWVQVELSRAPWISDEEKRRRVLAALRDFCEKTFNRVP